MDVTRLERISRGASGYNINLKNQVLKLSWSPSYGSRAQVYRGAMRSTGKKVAIKVICSRPPSDDKSIRVILRKVSTWSKLRHENIVRVSGITTQFDSLITEWANMGSAIDYVQNRSVDPRPLLIDVAHGLSYLHGQWPPIVHGDLRGKNVLISQNGRALVADYGVATLVDSDFDNSEVKVSSFDLVRWVAPETFESIGKPPTIEGDIWAYGMLILELVTTQPPFHETHGTRAVIARIKRGPPHLPSEKDAFGRLTKAWENACLSCWNRMPSERHPISEVLRMLQQY